MNTSSSYFDAAQSAIIEQSKEGIIILSCNLHLTYLNQKAKEICQQLDHTDYSLGKLPFVISNLLNWLSKNSHAKGKSFIMDYQIAEQPCLRIRVHHLKVDENYKACPWLILFLEDRNAVLQDELRIEQKKYNLTDREFQVLNLLSQSYSYQEISNALKITINTVKFHAKKIYLKKQRCLEGEFFMVLEDQKKDYTNE